MNEPVLLKTVGELMGQQRQVTFSALGLSPSNSFTVTDVGIGVTTEPPKIFLRGHDTGWFELSMTRECMYTVGTIKKGEDMFTAGINTSDYGFKIEVHDEDEEVAKELRDKILKFLNEEKL